MPEAVFDYTKVETVAKQLHDANNELVGKLAALQTQVTTMLSSGGGLYMEQSSPALHDAYIHFNAQLTTAMNNIGSFATQFDTIKQKLQEFDGNTQHAVITAGQKS